MKNMISNRKLFKLIFIIFSIVILYFIFYEYDMKSKLIVEQNLKETTQENNRHLNIMIKNKIDDVKLLLNSFAENIARYDNITDKALLADLERQTKGNEFLRLGITTPDGLSYTTDGVVHDSIDRSYFIEGMKGNSYISEVLISRVDQKKIITMSVPIKKGNTIVGVLRSSIEAKMLQSYFNLPTFPNDISSMILQKDGTCVTGSQSLDAENFFVFLNTTKFTKDSSLDTFKSNFAKGKDGMGTYNYRGETQCTYYSHIEGTNLIITTTFPYNLVNAQLSDSYQNTTELASKMAGIAILLILSMIYLERKNAQGLKVANEKLDAIIANTPGIILRYRTDNHLICTFYNDEIYKLTGYTKENFEQDLKGDLMNLVYPDDLQLLKNKIANDLINHSVTSYTYRLLSKDKKVIWIYDRREIVKEGSFMWFYISLVDVTDIKMTQEMLRISEKRYQMIIEQTEFIVFEWKVVSDVITFSKLWETKYGFKERYEDFLVLTEKYCKNISISYIPLMESLIRGKMNGQMECQLKKPDGTYIWCKITARSIKDSSGYLTSVIGSIEDIDDAKEHTMQLEEKTKIDGLTNIYNKMTTEGLIRNILHTSVNAKHILLIIDIDDFKNINDTLGHAQGDKVLRLLSRKIKECFRGKNIVGRIGGDEFLVFMQNVESTNQEFIDAKLDLLKDSLNDLPIIDNRSYKITCSIGVAIFQRHGTTYEELFENADKALYKMKKLGKNGHFYLEDPDLGD